jgi:DNA-binding NtrC family response regulator
VSIRQDALDKILTHHWPGNVRELENVITRAVVLAPGGVVTPEVIEFPAVTTAAHDGTWEARVPYREGSWPVLRRVETELIRTALREAGGNKAEAARILGIQRRLLYQKMSELGLV